MWFQPQSKSEKRTKIFRRVAPPAQKLSDAKPGDVVRRLPGFDQNPAHSFLVGKDAVDWNERFGGDFSKRKNIRLINLQTTDELTIPLEDNEDFATNTMQPGARKIAVDIIQPQFEFGE